MDIQELEWRARTDFVSR